MMKFPARNPLASMPGMGGGMPGMGTGLPDAFKPKAPTVKRSKKSMTKKPPKAKAAVVPFKKGR